MNRKSGLLRAVFAGALFALLSSSAGAALLQVTDGVLTGAKNVNVGGTYYDVLFQDGSCTSLYSGCSAAALTLASQEQALLAGQALLDQVFIDGADGNFDSLENPVTGCSSGASCMTLVAYKGTNPNVARLAWVTNNAPFFGVDSVIAASFPASIDTTSIDTYHYATFSLSEVQAVPEPGTVALLALSLAGLAFVRRGRV